MSDTIKTTTVSSGAISAPLEILYLVLHRHGLVKVYQPAIAWLGAERTRGASWGALDRRHERDYGRYPDGTIG